MKMKRAQPAGWALGRSRISSLVLRLARIVSYRTARVSNRFERIRGAIDQLVAEGGFVYSSMLKMKMG